MEDELNRLKALVIEWVKAGDVFNDVKPGDPPGTWDTADKAYCEAQDKLIGAGREYVMRSPDDVRGFGPCERRPNGHNATERCPDV